MSKGYIKLHRKILDDPIMLKPNYLAVWIYILLKVNYEDAYIIWNDKKTLIERGSFIGSIKKISKELKIPMTTVNRIINYLISETQVEKKSNNKFTLFKVINYDKYQKVESKTETKRKPSGNLAETNKKNKKNKNNNNIINNIIMESKNPINEIIDIFYQYSKNNRLFSNKTQRKAVEDLIKEFGEEAVIKFAKFAVLSNGKSYAPQITTPYQLQSKMGQLRAYYEQLKNNSQTKKPNIIKI